MIINKIKKLTIPKLRLGISFIINRLLLGKIIGNVPISVIADVKEIMEMDEHKNSMNLVQKIDDAYVEKYEFPDSYPIMFRRDKVFESKYIYNIKDAYISTNTGAVWTNSGKFLLDSIGSFGRFLGWGDALNDLLMSKYNNIIKEDLIVCPDTGYYHWLLEVLPNILHLLSTVNKDVKIAINKNAPKYLITALEFILKDDYNKRILILDKPAKVKSVYFAYYDNQSGFVRKADRDILKEYFLSNTKSQNHKDRNIYISRLKAPARSIKNEKEVEQILQSKGFEIIYAEDLNWLGQIELYNSASFIVATHGAGLSNIIWCKEHTKILEIFPYNKLHYCFTTLAKTNNLEYDYMSCDEDIGSHGKVDLNLLIQKVCG